MKNNFTPNDLCSVYAPEDTSRDEACVLRCHNRRALERNECGTPLSATYYVYFYILDRRLSRRQSSIAVAVRIPVLVYTIFGGGGEYRSSNSTRMGLENTGSVHAQATIDRSAQSIVPQRTGYAYDWKTRINSF